MANRTVKIPDNNKPFWSCEINGTVYTYPSGATKSVPSQVATLIENYYAMQPKEAEGGDVGGGGMTVAKLTREGSVFKCDMRVSEIVAAVQSGKPVALMLLMGPESVSCFMVNSILDFGSDSQYVYAYFVSHEADMGYMHNMVSGSSGSTDVWEVSSEVMG